MLESNRKTHCWVTYSPETLGKSNVALIKNCSALYKKKKQKQEIKLRLYAPGTHSNPTN